MFGAVIFYYIAKPSFEKFPKMVIRATFEDPPISNDLVL